MPDSYIGGKGGNLGNSFFDLAKCRQACQENPSCLAITLDERSSECYLKDKVDINEHELWHTEVKVAFESLVPSEKRGK